MSALCGLQRAEFLRQLAHVLYVSQTTGYQLVNAPNWGDLSFGEQHVYYLLADEVFAQLHPGNRSTWPQELFQHVAGVARREASKVVGHISPSEPYGVNDPIDPRD